MKNKKQFFGLITLFLSLTYGVIPLITNFSQADAQPNPSETPSPPEIPPPPDTPPPDNKTKPGGGLNPEPKSCNSQNGQFQALIPLKNPVLTTSSEPTVLIFLPDGSDSIAQAEFWVNTSQGKTKVNLTIPSQPGVISIKTPTSIEVDEYTPWYFKVTCKNEKTVILHGWFKRVLLTPDYQQIIEAGTPEIWYDVLANTAEELMSNSNDPNLKNRWIKLLESIQAGELTNQPIRQSNFSSDEKYLAK